MLGLDEDIVIRTRRIAPDSELRLLAYLDALTLDFERDAKRVSCVLIYAVPDPMQDGAYRFVPAAETGYEGIACLDDTARAALLALGVYERSGSRAALSLARRWLTFVEYMQYADGSFANFIRNAAGVRNATGPTSHRGGYWWSARALWALARAYRVTGEKRYLERYQQCRLPSTSDGKINAVLALSELEIYGATPHDDLRRSILDRCERIVGSGDDPYFRDHPDTDVVHLWGYHQLHAVATAARVLDEPRLLKPCRRTVQNLVEPDVLDRLWYSYPDRRKDGVCAYAVSPLVQGLAAMYHATEAKRYRRLALNAAAWFYGRNDARTAMYDPSTGRCRDGIAHGVASLNCGAESAIEAGLAELERRALLDQP